MDAFKDFKKKQLDKIVDALDIQDFRKDEIVIKKGQPGTSFYLIKQGTVGFALDDGVIKGTRGVSEYFGEVALLEGGDCTATAIAQTDCEFFVLTKTDFDRLVSVSLGEALDPLHNGLSDLLDAGGHPHMVSAKVQRMLKEYDVVRCRGNSATSLLDRSIALVPALLCMLFSSIPEDLGSPTVLWIFSLLQPLVQPSRDLPLFPATLLSSILRDLVSHLFSGSSRDIPLLIPDALFARAQDGDGQFSVDEVEAIISSLLSTKKQAKHIKYVAMAAFVALLAVCASMFAMSVLGAEVAKDVSQSDSGLMTVKGTDQVVQVASSDMVVGSDGSLVMRVATPWDEHCEDGHCETDTGRRALQAQAETPIRTAEYLTTHELSSTVPDKYLAELKSFMYTTPADGSTLSVQVDSFVRIPEYGAHCKRVICTSHPLLRSVCDPGTFLTLGSERPYLAGGSVVVLQTSLGNFTLDDKALYHTDLEQWVEVAGAFNLGDRRRMEETEEGQRQLGTMSADALFGFMAAEAATFECTR